METSDDFITAAPTMQREISGGGYVMAHHNISRWTTILDILKPIAEGEVTFEKIVEIILFFVNDEQFQSRFRRKGDKDMVFMLGEFFKTLSEQERIAYQTRIIPSLAQLVLETETLFPDDKRIPILVQGENEITTLSKRQCACLMAHMIFCIVVDQAEGFKLPELIDFSVIYQKAGLAKNNNKKIHKIRCIFTYFEKVLTENPEGNVTFERLFSADNEPWVECNEPLDKNDDDWTQCDESLTNARILSEGGIEDMRDALQVVFSDKELGDQVLQLPATQQQIMSLIHPELMLSLLFCEELKKNEAIRVTGAGRYSNYKGYGDNFEFDEPYAGDERPTERQHVIMDAEKYNSKQKESQFDKTWVLRELNKAYSGFYQEDEEENGRRVATGKWGCGVFKGNPQLKFIIQWLAASRARRDIVFYTYKDTANFNVENTKKILDYYADKEVKDLYGDLLYAAMDMQSEDMKTKSAQEESQLPRNENTVSDENKNLFKFLIDRRGL